MPLTFAYAGKLAPMIWALVALAAAELFVVHFLVSVLWSVTVAAVLSATTLLSILWMVVFIRSFRRFPVLVEEDGVLLRTGKRNALRIAAANVAGVRRSFSSGALKRRGVMNLALLTYPNVLVELAEPVKRRRGRPVTAVAHALEDPDGFADALRAIRELGT